MPLCAKFTHLSRGCTNIWKIFVLTDQIEETAHGRTLATQGKVAAHCIVDGVANLTILRHFLQYLCGVSDHNPNLVERLERVPSLEALYPKISLPRRRWRMAIAAVIYTIRTSRLNVRCPHLSSSFCILTVVI